MEQTSSGTREPIGTCPFCPSDPSRILTENEHAIAVRDKYPVSEGHTLAIPRRHVRSIFDLQPAEQVALWSMVTELQPFSLIFSLAV